MEKIKDKHQAVVMLQLAKNYFEEVAFEANQPPSVVFYECTINWWSSEVFGAKFRLRQATKRTWNKVM